VKYRNPWHKPGLPHYGPAFYETDATPVRHAGCDIYERVKGAVWDVVYQGACLTQCAGLGGARLAAENATMPFRGQ
jgi:hypothetical protein